MHTAPAAAEGTITTPRIIGATDLFAGSVVSAAVVGASEELKGSVSSSKIGCAVIVSSIAVVASCSVVEEVCCARETVAVDRACVGD